MGLTSFPNIAASDIGTVDTVQQAALNTLAYGDAAILVGTNTAVYSTPTTANVTRVNGNLYIYLKGVASTIVGSLVTYNHAGVTALADTSTTVGLPLAIATAATVANTFGWYLVVGTGVIAVNNDVAANSRLQTTATGGMVDDTTTANKYVNGLIARVATTAGAAAATLAQANFPIANLAV